MRIDQALAVASPGGAATGCALRLQELLPPDRRGNVYAVEIDGRLAGRVLPLAGAASDEHDLVLVHLTTPCRALVDSVLSTGRPVALLYDELVPPTFVDDLDPPLRDHLHRLDDDLKRLASVTHVAMATTEAGAARLAAGGFTHVEVVTPVLGTTDLLALEPHAPTHHHMQVTRTGPVALFVGQVAAHEHIDQLVAAYHLLISHHRPDAKLVIVGPPRSHAYTFALHRQIHELNLPHAWVAGDLTDAEVVAMYRNADLFVTLGEGAGFERSAVAAMAFGVPVVGRRSGSLPAATGDAALLLDAGDGIEMVAEALAEVLRNDALRLSLARRGRARAAQLDAPEAAARQLALITASA